MKRFFAAIVSVAVLGALAPTVDAQSSCPSEVQQAKEMFAKVAKAPEVQAPRTLAGARQDTQVQSPRGKEDVQAPRSLAGARTQIDVQSPRGKEDVQSPRGKQDVQAPRGKEDVQSPRGKQDVQSPRGKEDVQSPRGKEDVQSPRGKQDVQAPRGKQDVQAPRSDHGAGQAVQAPRGSDAAKLIHEAEAACKAGNMAEAKAKAEAALRILK